MLPAMATRLTPQGGEVVAVAELRPGDRVGLWSPNYAEWTLVQYATAEIGVILVNINLAYRTHELAYAVNQSGCRWVLASPEFKTSNYVDMVASVRDEVPGLERAVFFWTDESLKRMSIPCGRIRRKEPISLADSSDHWDINVSQF